MAPSRNRTTTQAPATIDSSGMLEAYAGMVMSIPEAAPSDGSEMLADIFAADDWEALNDERGKLPNAREVKNRDLKLLGITRHESTEEGGIGWYLVIEATDVRTGDTVRWQTSSMMVMAKIVKLSQLSLFPVLVRVTEKDGTTKAGRKPLDLRVLSVTQGGTPGY